MTEGPLPVTACYVNTCKNYFVREIVDVNQHPSYSFLLATQMYLVEDDNVDKIHGDSGGEEIATKRGSDIERYWQYKRGKKIE